VATDRIFCCDLTLCFTAQAMQLVDGSVRGVVCSTETSFTNIATLMAYAQHRCHRDKM
jgi:hypothetical protein